MSVLGEEQWPREISKRIEGFVSGDEKLQATCHEVVAGLMAKNEWRLIPLDEFVRIVYGRAIAEEGRVRSAIREITLNVYARTLYNACQFNQESANNQMYQRAYAELGHYLYNIALAKRPDSPQDAEDATQLAVVRIHQAFSENEIREPGAFLAFSINKLRAALTAIDRQKKIGGRKSLSWEEVTSNFQESDATSAREPEVAEQSHSSTGEKVERQQLVEEITAELQRKFRIHPRATKQLQAVLLKYAYGYSNKEIAKKLDVPGAAALSTLISRGKEKLKKNEELEALYTHYFSLETQSHAH